MQDITLESEQNPTCPCVTDRDHSADVTWDHQGVAAMETKKLS